MIQIDKPMPEGCDVCPLMYDYIKCNALPEDCEDDDAFNEEDFDWTKRPEWCPLKEKPQIVLCKNCKNADYGTDEDGNRFMKCIGSVKCYGGTTPDFFCADGERKNE